MRSLRTLLLILFFAGLAALEISHGLFRIETIRNERRRELLGEVERGHAEQARQLRVAFDQGRYDAAWFARLPAVATVLAAPGAPDAALSHSLFAMLGAVPHFSELTIFDPTGKARWAAGRGTPEESRERDLQGGGADPALTRMASKLAPGVVLQSHAYLASISAEGSPAGFLVLTIDAEPLRSALDYRPLEGTATRLVDDSGRDATDEWPGPVPASLLSAARVQDDVPAAAVAGPARTETPTATYVSLAVSEAPNPPLRLVTIVPESTLEAPLAGDYAWTVALMIVVTAVLVAAGSFILRLSERAFRLAESERTLRREQEVARQLQIAERLSSVGLLTAGVAHEINNPLEGIGNYLALLKKDELDPERRARYLDQVRHGFDRIQQIVADLLRFSRPTAERGRIDLGSVVERSVSMAAYGKHFKQVSVERVGLDRPLIVSGDAGRLEQVLLNLLLNAARAMDGQGCITITGSRTSATSAAPAASGAPGAPGASGSEPARWVELTVEDEGAGIAPADLDRLFDPFFSASGGTGLGLSVSYGIVAAHGGTLTAANRATRGACFTLRLPAEESGR